MKRILAACSLLFTALFLSGCAAGMRAPSAPVPQGDGAEESASEMMSYDEAIPDDAEPDEGLFTVYTPGDSVLYEIPDSLMGRKMLMVTRIARTAADIGYGGEKANTMVVRWQKKGDQVLLRVVSFESVADTTQPIYRAVKSATFDPILRSFPIRAVGPNSSVVIDVTELYATDVPALGLGQERREEFEVRGLDEDRSFVESAHSYPKNIEVDAILTYTASDPPSNAATNTISLEMSHSMVALPANPMEPRRCDRRVGYYGVTMTDYGAAAQQAQERCYITRWRLVPSDTAAYRRGELVEPVEPIVYYIDPATPKKWRRYIERGVEAWQEAFRAAGFKNAILAKMPPTEAENPHWSAEDVRYSVIRWFPSEIQNAYGPHVSDPRTGEILEADIGMYHNVMSLLRDWYFVQTAAANPKARGVEFADSVMGRLIQFVVAHEVGHTLGLAHNMKASAAYPVDSLRTSFSCRMGTAPSIMDYARFNYVAQPSDDEACFLPKIGPYDVWAIRWGYQPIMGHNKPGAAEEILNEWIREKYPNPMYLYSPPSAYDPTAQTEALGDDAMKASRYGIKNLKRIVPHLIDWTYRRGEGYGELEELYNAVINQWNLYMGHVVTNIGGVVRTFKTYNQGPVYEIVSEETQRRAMDFLAEYAFETPRWMLNEKVLRRIEHAGAVNRIRELQVGVLEDVLDPNRMQRLIAQTARLGGDAYTLGEMLTHLRGAVWTELDTGEPIGVFRRNLQRGYLERMAWLMTAEPDAPPEWVREYYGYTAVDVSQSDIRAFVRGELEALRAEIRDTLDAGVSDRATRLHLEDALVRIEEILEPEDA